MNEYESYLFDPDGYLVVEDVLTFEELRALNAAIDANPDRVTERESQTEGSAALQGRLRHHIHRSAVAWDLSLDRVTPAQGAHIQVHVRHPSNGPELLSGGSRGSPERVHSGAAGHDEPHT